MNLRLRKIFSITLLSVAAVLVAIAGARAQESSSKPEGSAAPAVADTNPPVPPNSPSAALRNALSAACEHNQSAFANFLTARNKESFQHLANGARLSLMKRFVLLDEAGKPTSTTNPSGRPIVRCETPSVTTDMQIGGTDLRENIAFMPLDLRDSTDGSGATTHVVTMGMVRENGEWKILSLGLLMLDLPALEVEWDSAEIASNEAAALESLKKIASAIESYRTTYSRIPDSLNPLAPPLHGAPTRDAAGLLDADLAAGKKNGYVFRYVLSSSDSLGAPAKFELSAAPSIYERTGLLSFFRDANGNFHSGDHRGGVGNDRDPNPSDSKPK